MGPICWQKNVPLKTSVESRPTSKTEPSSLPISPEHAELFFTCELVGGEKERELLVYYCMRDTTMRV